MQLTSVKIKVLYDSMSKSEKLIADWINEHPGELISLSIVELAECCSCSEATIVRFAKRLGLSGYQELKLTLASEGGGVAINTHISEIDTPYDIYGKVCNDIYCSLEMTKSSLDPKALKEAANAICKAKRIIIIGLGNSASVAMDMSHKLLRIGLDVVAYSDNHMQVIASSHLGSDDLAIAISHSGSSKDVVDALKIAKEHGAKTMAITAKGKSPIQKTADIVLSTYSAETSYNILALNSRIAQLSIVDTLYFYVAFHYSQNTIESIQETERSLLSKKY